MPKKILSIHNLEQQFLLPNKQKINAVDGVDLDVYEGETLGIVGESGSGKSTLAKSILGLNRRTNGEVFFEGKALPLKTNAKYFRHNAKRMQMIFQDPYSSLNPKMTVFDIVKEALLLQGVRKKIEIQKKVKLWLEKVNLSQSCQNYYPHQLSGGQCQRVGIARALIIEPKLLICDEPLSALDISIQAQIVNLLLDLKINKYTFIFIAHDLSMVAYLSDRVAVMNGGKIVEIGTKNDIFERPHHPYTKSLLAANFIPVVADKNENK